MSWCVGNQFHLPPKTQAGWPHCSTKTLHPACRSICVPTSFEKISIASHGSASQSQSPHPSPTPCPSHHPTNLRLPILVYPPEPTHGWNDTCPCPVSTILEQHGHANATCMADLLLPHRCFEPWYIPMVMCSTACSGSAKTTTAHMEDQFHLVALYRFRAQTLHAPTVMDERDLRYMETVSE